MNLYLYKNARKVCSQVERMTPLDIVITLLENTSKLILLFNDRLYTTFTNDVRLQKLNNFDNWMHSSEESTQGDGKLFISSKLWFDLKSMYLGFQSLVHYKLSKHPNSVINPAMVVKDVYRDNSFKYEITML